MSVGAPAEAAPVDDDPIVALVRDGAYKEAATRCVREHSRAIGRMCMAMLGDQAEAEEAVQETFLSAHRSIAQFRGEGRVLSWLISIARRICVRRIETRARQHARRLELVHDAEAVSPMELAERKHRARSLRDALAKLKPSEREILLLRYQAELSFREVAEVSGIDEPAARKRTSRALARLRTLLKHEVE
jgi:RNA polymerase sigma-70 factor (ECF subfamily)